MKKLRKIGLLGLLITLLISALLFFSLKVSMSILTPFFMPWLVLILISFATKSTNK
jgi:hypothetical protein